MKKILTMILLTASLSASAQKPKDTVPVKKDSIPAKPDIPVYGLFGQLQAWQLLFLLADWPDDVTPNQRKELAAWMQKNLFIVPKDTTSKK